ncbi:MAG: V-type ATP synthase subunit F [Oscillospiraceae bacterium]
MFKAAVIGDRESIMGFRALGLTVAAANAPQEAADELHRLARSNYAVIYITEQLAEKIPEDIAKYNNDAAVAIIPIPSKDGSLGIGVAQVHKAVEKAVGADILKDQ